MTSIDIMVGIAGLVLGFITGLLVGRHNPAIATAAASDVTALQARVAAMEAKVKV